MVKDTQLYNLLGVSPTADDAELKKGYRKAALKFHPDKPTGNEEKFKDVGEAYDILSNKDKRAIYDQYGLEAARTGQTPMPDFGAGGGGGGAGGFPGGGFSSFSGGMPGGGASSFTSDDAFNIFNMFGGMGGMGGGGMGGGMPGGMPGGMGGGGMDDLFGGMGGMGGGSRRGGRAKSARTAPVEPKEIELPVALRDLYTGTTKKLKIKRKGVSGAAESTVVEVQIKAGWKAGTKLTYKGKGDVQPDGSVQDIVFVIREKPDPEFARDGNDLKIRLKLSLKEALTGFERIVTTLDGKKLKVSQGRPVQPGQEFRFPDRGMPIPKEPGHFGALRVEVSVDFPLSLSPEQRKAIEENF